MAGPASLWSIWRREQMKSVMYVGALLVLTLSMGCSVHSYASAIVGSFDRTLYLSGTVDLDVSTGSGSITIRQGTGNRVEIHGRIRAGDNWFSSNRNAEEAVRRLEANPPIEQTGSIIRVGRTSDSDWMRNVSISYDI